MVSFFGQSSDKRLNEVIDFINLVVADEKVPGEGAGSAEDPEEVLQDLQWSLEDIDADDAEALYHRVGLLLDDIHLNRF